MNLCLKVANAVVMASAVALGAAPLVAQSNNTATAPLPGSSSDIGPGELSNFSLNGTVTRPVDRPPATQPATPLAPAAGPAASPAPRDNRPTAPPETGQPAAPRPDPANSDLFRRPPTLPDASSSNAMLATPPIESGDQSTNLPALASEGFQLLPWIIALFAVAGAGVMFFGRRRQQLHATAGNPPIDITRPDPVPAPAVAPRVAPAPLPNGAPTGARRPLPTTLMPPPPISPPVQPKADPVVPRGIVSTGLRPWIDVELTPDRALLDEAGVAIAFEVTLFNSGSAAARDVIVEARLLNAGVQQDIELSTFFTADGAPGDPIPQIAPYARIPLRSAVRLPLANIREYELEGRKLFVPMVAISVRYRWSNGNGQSAVGFLVGQSGEGQEKLAPFRIDRGARSWKGLGVRRYEKGLRS
ncbi:MAG: hypothetical protein LH610_01450 [Sphingomonas bacterium]|nr:hypothetical protein [Sphingomonas bacterium]